MRMTTNKNDYFLPTDYRPNPPTTIATLTSQQYWTERRIRASSKYQYSVYREAYRLAGQLAAQTVVDIGCGVATKLNLFFAREFEIYGVDTAEAVRLCRERFSIGNYYVDDLERPSLDLRSLLPTIDVVICSDVIEHLSEPDFLLDYLRNISFEHTHLVLSTPARENLLGDTARSPSNPEHVREWSVSEFRSCVEAFGFRILRHIQLLPFHFGPDRLTVAFIMNRLKSGLPLRTNQMIICKLR